MQSKTAESRQLVDMEQGTAVTASFLLLWAGSGKNFRDRFSHGERVLLLASERPQDIRKVVLFYGSYGVDFSKVQASILGHYASTDEFEPLEGIRAMEADMRTAGLQPTFHIYPDTHHWFFEEDRPQYDPQAANRAWERTFEFLRG
jgi:carboxymethylenebutenolidase